MPSIKAILEPVSIPDLEPIPVEGTLFPIGRTEPFFTDLPEQARGKLSRRHARIFEEQGELYITDLGSLNGTSLNGKNLVDGQPQALRESDLIDIAGDITFRVKLPGEDQAGQVEEPTRELRLILKPLESGSDLETIVVTQFPFLIARKDSIFEKYNTGFAEEVGQISRRHAVVTAAHGKLYIEDLGSRNGTSINGDSIGEHAVPIGNGDTLAIGGDHFVYGLIIPETEPVAPVTAASATDPDWAIAEQAIEPSVAEIAITPDERTMFVDSPTSFLDIFCGEEEAAGSGANDIEADKARGAGAQAGSAPATGVPGKLGAARHQARAIHRAFTGETKSASKTPRILGAVLAIVAVAMLIGLLYKNDKDKIRELLDDGQYAQGAQLANAYLSNHPDNREIQTLGAKALVKAAVPEWMQLMEASQFREAEALLERYSNETGNLKTGVEQLALLGWLTSLEQHVARRGGIDGRIEIFKDELEMKSLIESWNRSFSRNQQLLDHITSWYPEFEVFQKDLLSDFRRLRHDHSLYGGAIDELTRTINDSIRARDSEQISTALTEYQFNYPKLAGLEALASDNKTYAQALQDLGGADLGTLVAIRRGLEFTTPLFIESAGQIIEPQLPNERVITQYEKSLEVWRRGEVATAIEILQELEQDPKWRAQVANQIERFRNISAAYDVVVASAEEPNHKDRLLKFHSVLRDSEDTYYLEATSQDFDRYRDSVLASSQVKAGHAGKAWVSYRQAGGITSIMRIEEPVSKNYRKQADQLKTAAINASAAIHGYRLVKTEPPQELTELNNAIEQETRRQRSWIEDLGVVLKPALLKSKLELLPLRVKEES